MQQAEKIGNSKYHSPFIETSERFAKMAMVDDFALIPYRDPSLPYFSQIPESDQNLILQQMELMIHVGAQLHNEKRSIRGSQYAWAFCKALGGLHLRQ